MPPPPIQYSCVQTRPPCYVLLTERTNERTNERQQNSTLLSVRATVEFVYTAVCALLAVRCFLLVCGDGSIIFGKLVMRRLYMLKR